MAFHPYPQVIREFCNIHRFGPPAGVTLPSACSWIDHSVSGLIRRTERPVQTRFRCAYAYRLKLARQTKSLTHYTKGTPSPRTNLGLRLFVGIRFQVYFTPLVGVLFTFPSRYLCTIGRRGVLRLGRWSSQFQTGFHVSRPTQGHNRYLPVRGYHPLRPDFPDGSGLICCATGLVRVRSPLLAESRLMSFPPGTEMFHFPGFASLAGWLLRAGFPHSEIHGSKPVRSSPRLIAAYHVLHRLSTPRHPPNALLALDRSHYRCPSNPSGSYSTDERPVSKIIHLPAVRHRNQRQKARPDQDCNPDTRQAQSPPTARRGSLHVPMDNSSLHDVRLNAPHPGASTLRNRRNRSSYQTRTTSSPLSSSKPRDQEGWWSRTGSNRRPEACKATALPTELRPQFGNVVRRRFKDPPKAASPTGRRP